MSFYIVKKYPKKQGTLKDRNIELMTFSLAAVLKSLEKLEKFQILK